MPKKRKFHKTVIHPNRYLIWALALMVIVAGVLVAVIKIGDINSETEFWSHESNLDYWHTYKDASLTLRYPAEWLIDPGQGYIGFGPKNEDKFLIYSYSPPNDPAYDSYSKLPSVRSITVDGLPGIRVPDAKTGERIAFVKTSSRLYEFRGTTPSFDIILSSVKFLKK